MPKTPIVEIFKRMPELSWIVDKALRKATVDLLIKFPDYIEQPSSVSGKHHKGETKLQHVRMAAHVMQLICNEFDIRGIRRDKLISAILLHDIGYTGLMKPGKIPGWKYYEETGWSSKSRQENINHPLHGFNIIKDSTMAEEHKIEIANMVLKHMSHWYDTEVPNPETEDEKWVALSDFVASRKEVILTDFEGD